MTLLSTTPPTDDPGSKVVVGKGPTESRLPGPVV